MGSEMCIRDSSCHSDGCILTMKIVKVFEDKALIQQAREKNKGMGMSPHDYGTTRANTLAKVTPLSPNRCDVSLVDMPDVFATYLDWISDAIREAYPESKLDLGDHQHKGSSYEITPNDFTATGTLFEGLDASIGTLFEGLDASIGLTDLSLLGDIHTSIYTPNREVQRKKRDNEGGRPIDPAAISAYRVYEKGGFSNVSRQTASTLYWEEKEAENARRPEPKEIERNWDTFRHAMYRATDRAIKPVYEIWEQAGFSDDAKEKAYQQFLQEKRIEHNSKVYKVFNQAMTRVQKEENKKRSKRV